MPKFSISHPALPGTWTTEAADIDDARVIASTGVVSTLRLRGLADADTTLADVTAAITVKEAA